MKQQARTRTRHVATTTPAPAAPKAEFRFLDHARGEPDRRALAVNAYQDAFDQIAEARVQELRAEVLQSAEQLARAFVSAHERALADSMKLD